jgi:heme exporter protein C
VSAAPATIHAVGRLSRIPLSALAAASLVLVTTALIFVFYVAPNDDPVHGLGFGQRIFYFHVSIALTAYACFGCGAWQALRHLWKRDPRADLQSYVCVHQGTIFGAMVLLTGSIWAKYSWGHWWVWSEDELVLFLILYLFYCAYFMLRFSVDPGPQRANLSAVYALFGVVLIPVSFAAIRLAKEFLHPRVFTLSGPRFGGWILVTYCVAQVAMLVLAYTLYRIEIAGKRLDLRLRDLKEVLA